MILLDKKSAVPCYQQIYEQILQEITDGVLKEGALLTGSRELAKTLNVSRNTVCSAYSQLLSEGYLISKKGTGYVIADMPKALTSGEIPGIFCHQPPHLDSGTSKVQTPDATFTPASTTASTAASTSHSNTGNVLYDLTNSSHTSDLFPKKLWRKYTLECLDRLEQEEKLSIYQEKQGEFYLRFHLLKYLERIRGIHCQEDQIIITSGLQQSLDFVCKLLGKKRQTILMEEPGYNKAVAVFSNNGLHIQTIPVDENGLITDDLPVSKDVCAVYSTPSHQFPTGSILPIGRRFSLMEWAEKNDSYILEDDYDSELRYYARPVPSLQSVDKNDRVIYLGTFSKGLSPSIRMGYLILPRKLLPAYREMFKNYNCTAPLLNQYVIGRLFETGEYERHMRRMNRVFRKRLDLFLEGFLDVKEKVRITSNGSGQYFLLQFCGHPSQSNLIEKALDEGVRVYPTMEFWQDKAACPPDTIFLGFSKINLADIPDCIARLKRAWAEYL